MSAPMAFAILIVSLTPLSESFDPSVGTRICLYMLSPFRCFAFRARHFRLSKCVLRAGCCVVGGRTRANALPVIVGLRGRTRPHLLSQCYLFESASISHRSGTTSFPCGGEYPGAGRTKRRGHG